MKQKKSKITIIAVWILLCGCVVCMESCSHLLYNPSNKVSQILFVPLPCLVTIFACFLIATLR